MSLAYKIGDFSENAYVLLSKSVLLSASVKIPIS